MIQWILQDPTHQSGSQKLWRLKIPLYPGIRFSSDCDVFCFCVWERRRTQDGKWGQHGWQWCGFPTACLLRTPRPFLSKQDPIVLRKGEGRRQYPEITQRTWQWFHAFQSQAWKIDGEAYKPRTDTKVSSAYKTVPVWRSPMSRGFEEMPETTLKLSITMFRIRRSRKGQARSSVQG